MFLLLTDTQRHSEKLMSIQNAAGMIPAQVSSAMANQTMNQPSTQVAINYLTFPFSFKGAVVTKNVYPSKIRVAYVDSHD